MNSADIPTVLIALGSGAFGGWLVRPSGGGVLVGLVLGLLTAVAVARFGVRPFVALSILAGTLAGAFIGRMIVRLLCLPSECAGLEIAGSVLMGGGALVGVGLVIVLVTRSFEEHRERTIADAQAAADAIDDD